jgi:protein-S-isoprenylcysteine O-methyltransferase Ste14
VLLVARLVVAAGWLFLFVYWIRRWNVAREGRSERGRTVNPASMAGLVLEIAAFLLLIVGRRSDPGLPDFVYAAAAALQVVSVEFGRRAALHLGTQLRIQAVVTEGHRLITTGPYSIVRHPIYASLFGMLVGTGLVFSDWRAVLAGFALMVCGIEIRVHAEEKLLVAHFGAEYEAYRRRVKAYLPAIR